MRPGLRVPRLPLRWLRLPLRWLRRLRRLWLRGFLRLLNGGALANCLPNRRKLIGRNRQSTRPILLLPQRCCQRLWSPLLQNDRCGCFADMRECLRQVGFALGSRHSEALFVTPLASFCSGLFRRYGPRISIRRHLRRGGGRADHDVHRRARDVRGIHDARDVHDARVRPNKTGGSKLHRSDSD
jgi:hypothetical protein